MISDMNEFQSDPIKFMKVISYWLLLRSNSTLRVDAFDGNDSLMDKT